MFYLPANAIYKCLYYISWVFQLVQDNILMKIIIMGILISARQYINRRYEYPGV